jgi:hypothetical protein
MSKLPSRLTKSEQARLLEELNYMNLEEIRGFCSARGIPFRIVGEYREREGEGHKGHRSKANRAGPRPRLPHDRPGRSAHPHPRADRPPRKSTRAARTSRPPLLSLVCDQMARAFEAEGVEGRNRVQLQLEHIWRGWLGGFALLRAAAAHRDIVAIAVEWTRRCRSDLSRGRPSHGRPTVLDSGDAGRETVAAGREYRSERHRFGCRQWVVSAITAVMDEHGWKSPAAGTTPDLRAQDEASGRTSIGSGEPEDCPAAAVSGVSAATANPAVQMTVGYPRPSRWFHSFVSIRTTG